MFINEPLHKKKDNLGFLTKSATNHPVQSQKQARSLKLWIEEGDGLYYLCYENKGADQLCSYCTADLRLCFRLSILLVILCSGSNLNVILSHSFFVCSAGIYGVGKAAVHAPALAILSHRPKNAQKNIAWVGKGIVFDTGGLCIKTKVVWIELGLAIFSVN